MKSKIEVRKFAIEKAIEIMGVGTPDKDVISKAQQIETYIIGQAQLPETDDSEQALMNGVYEIIDSVKANLK
jgi:hypothetical protein